MKAIGSSLPTAPAVAPRKGEPSTESTTVRSFHGPSRGPIDSSFLELRSAQAKLDALLPHGPCARGPIEAFIRRRCTVSRNTPGKPTFHGPCAVAPLKLLYQSALPTPTAPALLTFPRPQCRGPIEARSCLRLDPRSARFPRPPRRGPIEARCARSDRDASKGIAFHGPCAVAPLKRARRHAGPGEDRCFPRPPVRRGPIEAWLILTRFGA